MILMPVVFRVDGARFFFYSNEGSPREPVHIHVQRAEAQAKFWLLPEVKLAENEGFNRGELMGLTRIIQNRRAAIERAWHEHFG